MEKNFDDNKNHSRSIIDYLIIVWFGLMGADRIDLFGGDGYFIFTPFLFLSLILVFFLFNWSSFSDIISGKHDAYHKQRIEINKLFNKFDD